MLILFCLFILGCETGTNPADNYPAGLYPFIDEKQIAIMALVNGERRKAGVPELTAIAPLSQAAMIRAKELTASFSHTRPDGKSCFTVLSENGIQYKSAGENIAMGQRTAEAVMNSWMNSSGHKNNILNPKFTMLGVGHYSQNNTTYWVQLFISQ